MLGGLLGGGFSSKCKSLIKATRTRIEVLRKRAEAKQRFLKEDLAKLLANGLDNDAYGRTEEFLAGQSLLSCYDFIEQSCEYTVKQLSSLQKQRECPEGCREAVASLMFAAARFSDLPELRDIRDLFQERYGNSLEYFVNKKFVEILALKPPTMEKRLHLLQDIALEFSLKWDSRGFKERMAIPSAFAQDQPKNKKYGPSHIIDDKYKLLNGKDAVPKTDKHDVSSKGRYELANTGHKAQNGRETNVLKRDEVDFQIYGRQETTNDKHKSHNNGGETIPKDDKRDISFRVGQDFTADKHGGMNRKEDTSLKTVRPGSSSRGKRLEWIDGGYKMQKDSLSIVPRGESQDPLPCGKSEVAANCAGIRVQSGGKDVSYAGNDRDSQQNIVNSTKKVREEEADRFKSYNNALTPPYVKSKDVLPPPYIKSKDGKCAASKGSRHAGVESDGSSIDPSPHNRANAVNRQEMIQKEPDNYDHERQGFRSARVNSDDYEKDHLYQNDIPLPKPRSLRRKHSKPSSGHEDVDNFEDAGVVKRSSSSRRREHSAKGLQILFDDEHYQKDKEERMIDKLLLHYSKKSSTHDMGMLGKKSQLHPSHQIAGESSQNRSRDGDDVKSEMVPYPARSLSLPHEQTATSAAEATKVFARGNSFQPDNQVRHVHPKLPDYDDLAARFAALRGR